MRHAPASLRRAVAGQSSEGGFKSARSFSINARDVCHLETLRRGHAAFECVPTKLKR